MTDVSRGPNSTAQGRSFTLAMVRAVWAKAQAVGGYDPDRYRKDSCGAWIEWSAFSEESGRGWEIDHVLPVARGGTDDFANLQALHWQNNRAKGDAESDWKCAVTGQ